MQLHFRRDGARSVRRRCEAAVVGAGPAGCACAAALSRAGAGCLIVDWRKHPQGKPCGGAVSPRAAGILERAGLLARADLDEVALARHRTMSCFWKGHLLRTYESTGEPVRMVERRLFDETLFEKAVEYGAVPVCGEPVTGVFPGRPCIVELRSGERLEAEVVVGADGADSVVRRVCSRAGLRAGGFGIECFVETPSDLPEGLQIHFGIVSWGYGWLFPRGEDVCIGVGAIGRRASPPALKAALDRLLATVCPGSAESPPLRAAPIPGYGIELSPAPGRIFLCGDAAGLTDRLTGEGIGYAVESGLLVARAVLEGWSRDRLSREAGRGCAGLVRQSIAVRHLVYHPMLRREAMRRLASKDKFYAGYWDLISGSVDYRGLLLGFLRSSRWPPASP